MRIVKGKDIAPIKRDDGRSILQYGEQILGFDLQKASSVNFIRVTHPPNFTEEQHYHKKSHEIFYFLDPAKYRINGRDFNVDAGDLIIFEPNDVHGGLPTPNKVDLFIIQIPKIPKEDKFFVR